MEDDRSKNLRKLIQEVQQDKSLTPQEKARKIQRLMSGKPANEEKEKDTLSTLDISVTFRDQENNILGCKHYMRNAKIRAKCCGQLFSCRFCHDEKVHDHQINRFEVEEMFCMLCNNLGPIDKFCRTCMKEMGVYYCNVCKFIDNDPNKTIYHCTHCGICRIGKGLDIDYFHCMKCNACLAIGLKGNHKCIENNFKSNCPICRDDLFSSRESATVLNCGHSMHAKCYNRYVRTNFVCPLCHKSLGDMKDSWESLDQAIGAQPMPVEFANAKCMVLCNDCEQKTEAPYHFLGLKCQKEGCGSYNTNILSTSGFPDRSQLNLLVNNNNNNNNNNNSSDNNSNNNNNNNENSNNTEIIIEDDSSDESDYEEYDDSNEEEETAPQ